MASNAYILYIIQILFVAGISIGAEILNFEDNNQKWLNIARYATYILTLRAIPEACKLAHAQCRRPDPAGLLKAADAARGYALVYAACAALLLYCGQGLFRQDFVYVAAAYLLLKYPEMSAKTSVNYGVGMACSYFEGYLMHILPSDGATFVGFEENMRALEDAERVLFPVKKMFIIITKTLYSPPDLKEFNKGQDVPYLEQMRTFADVTRSVAGVKDRRYHNTAYKIYRPSPAPPVCLAAECATPLHTLHRVLANHALYSELADVDVAAVVDDFCSTLRKIIEKSPQCRGKCELIFYDPDDPTQNLSEILLARIRELVPDFEQRILARRQENVLE